MCYLCALFFFFIAKQMEGKQIMPTEDVTKRGVGNYVMDLGTVKWVVKVRLVYPSN